MSQQPRRPPTGPGGYELSAAHRQVITSNRTFLVQKLNPYSVMQPLIQRQIFAEQDRDLVIGHSREDAVRNLLHMLARKGPNALSAFIGSLMETNQADVAHKLSAGAPDILTEQAPPVLPQPRLMETLWEPMEDFRSVEEPLRILKFHPGKQTSQRPHLCIPTLIVSSAKYGSGTGRRQLLENPILIEKLESAFDANPAFEVLPAMEDWSAGEILEGVQFFADNCYDADAVLIVVFGHASSDLQHFYTCDNEMVSIKNVLLDPIVTAAALIEKPKLFLFCLTVEDRRDFRKFTYGFVSDDVKLFLQRRGDEDFVGELCRMLRSDPRSGSASLSRLETFCKERCDRL